MMMMMKPMRRKQSLWTWQTVILAAITLLWQQCPNIMPSGWQSSSDHDSWQQQQQPPAPPPVLVLVAGFQPASLPLGVRRSTRLSFLQKRIAGQYSYNNSNSNNSNDKNNLALLSSRRQEVEQKQQQQQQQPDSTSSSSSSADSKQRQQQSSSSSSSSPIKNKKKKKKFKHAMAILAMPYCSIDRIANEVILNTVLPRTDKLSVVLRCESPQGPPSLPRLRRYVGEVYSQLWDCVMYETLAAAAAAASSSSDNDNSIADAPPPPPPVFALPDICVYPANLPNAAPESWIDIQPDLEAVCSHDSITGWISEGATGTGVSYQRSEGVGGLTAHVRALNAERAQRGLKPVQALPVPENQWPIPSSSSSQSILPDETVIFVDDDPEDQCQSPLWQAFKEQTAIAVASAAAATAANAKNNNNNNNNRRQQQQQNYNENDSDDDDDTCLIPSLLGGANIPNKALFESVCCGGTFDGLHFGHRKLLTLAVSSVNPMTGRLLIGVTVDRMLTKKQYAEYMPSYAERVQGVRTFLHRLAPGMMNRVQIVPIEDAFGPPGQAAAAGAAAQQFDALVLSHETLETGHQLNRHRVEVLKLKPLTLLCTRRTEAHGMSSTTLRKLRAENQMQQQQQQQQNNKQ